MNRNRMLIAPALLSFLLFSGCSNLKRTLIYSSLAGGTAGVATGVVVAPNKKSRPVNMAVYGALGAGLAALAGYRLHRDDPRNRPLAPMLDPQPRPAGNLEIESDKLRISAAVTPTEIYRVPVMELPPALVGKVGRQYLIKYRSKERTLRRGGMTWYIPGFDIYRYAYGDNTGPATQPKEEQ